MKVPAKKNQPLTNGHLTITLLLFLFSHLFIFHSAAQMRHVYLDADDNNDITKISFYTPSNGYVAFKNWIGFTTDTGRTYLKKYIALNNVDYNGYAVNVTFGFTINGVKAFNQDTIFAYGHYGLVPSILYSVNGGTNFKLVYHSQFNANQLRTGITDMIFPENNSTGYAIDADRILKTTDKGVNWIVSLSDAGSFFDFIEAPDNNNVFAICRTQQSKIRRTVNAGSTWTLLPLPPGTVNYVSFITPSKGWLNMDNNGGGSLYYSSNNGTNWVQKTNNVVQSFLCEKMKFINDSTGFALIDPYKTYKTSDSGKVWQKIPRDTNFTYLGYSHYDLFVRDINQFWAGGGHGFLELTTNGGGSPIPAPLFLVDTTNLYLTNTVNLKNYSKGGYQYSWYVNHILIGNAYNASYTHNIYLAQDTIALIVSDGINSDTAFKYPQFTAIPYPSPLITSFTPVSGGAGTAVTITGNYFVGVTAVSFGGIPAASFTVNSITQITAIVGEGANGNVSVTTPRGIGSLSGFITYPPPVINSFSPLSGPVGSTVIINGVNFSTTPANNIVYFGSVKAQVLTASANQLTVAVPVGAIYEPLTVTVNRHTAYSGLRFSITFPSTCSFTEFSFDAGKSYGLGAAASESQDGNMVIGDMDNDGKNDIVSIHWNGFSVLRNTSIKGFVNFDTALKVNSTGTPFAMGVAVADIDGDGKLDVAVANYSLNTVSVFKNTSTTGNLAFSSKIDLSTSTKPNFVTFTDLDSDGKPDMLVTNSYSNTVSIYRNISLNGNIAFSPKQDIVSGLSTVKVCTGDLDGDGKADLFILDGGILNSGLYTFSVYRNTSSIGSISFANIQVFNHYTFSHIEGSLLDADNDGKLDICVVYDIRYTISPPGSTALFRNTSTVGNISFSPPYGLSGCPYNRTISYGDLDGDSKIDLFSSCWVYNNVKLFGNRSTAGNISYTSANSPYIVIPGSRPATAIADIDGDSKPDLITGASPTIFRNILNERGAWAGKDTILCLGQSIKLGGFDAAGHSYSWTSSPVGFTSSTANPVVTPTVNTKYYVSVTNPQGCVTKDTIEVLIGGPAPIVNAGPDNSICIGNSIQIGTAAIGTNTYSWTSVPAGFTSTLANPVVSPTVSTTYFLTVNSGTCIAKDNINIAVNSLPLADAGLDKSTCATIGIYIGPGFTTNGNTYSWTSSPSGFTSTLASPYVVPSVTTSYFLAVTNSKGCTSMDTAIVNVIPSPTTPILTASGPVSFCTGESVSLTSSVATGIQWYKNGIIMTGITSQTITITENGIYSVRTTTSQQCIMISNYFIVTVSAPPATPVISTSGNSTFCSGGSVVLSSTSSTGYQWYRDGVVINNATNQTYSATSAGSYTVKNIINGCASLASNVITVIVNPIPALPVITQSGNLLTSSGLSGNQWFLNGTAIAGATNNTYSPQSTGLYTVKVTANGCTSVASAAFNYVVTAINSTDLNRKIIITPNPARDNVLIRFTGNNSKFYFTLTDITGKSIFNNGEFSNSIQLDLKRYSAGLYIIHIVNKWTGEQIERLILKQ